ncbi:MAG: hypothetical protein CL946_06455 [Ectothiorhodospiraceae bacterium]|nr:hypothetical protein [Ectothiorhodospiraceae bacterium]
MKQVIGEKKIGGFQDLPRMRRSVRALFAALGLKKQAALALLSKLYQLAFEIEKSNSVFTFTPSLHHKDDEIFLIFEIADIQPFPDIHKLRNVVDVIMLKDAYIQDLIDSAECLETGQKTPYIRISMQLFGMRKNVDIMTLENAFESQTGSDALILEELTSMNKDLTDLLSQLRFKNDLLPYSEKVVEELMRERDETRALLKETLAKHHKLQTTLDRKLSKDIEQLSASAQRIETGVLDNSILQERELAKDHKQQVKALLSNVENTIDQNRLSSLIKPLEIEEFTFQDLVPLLRAMFVPVLGESEVSMTFQVEDNLPALKTDKGKLFRVLQLLLDNAVKYTERGSIKLQVSLSPRHDEIIIRLQDTGIGISPEHHRSIFSDTREVTSPDERPYIGERDMRGLPFAKNLLRTLGGKISLDSKVGTGSVFTLVVPKYHAMIAQEEAKRQQQETLQAYDENRKPESTEKISVLVVEDDESTQFLMKKILDTQFNVYTAASGDEAMEVLEKRHIKFIFMDIALRGSMDGIEITRQLRAMDEWRNVPIVALTTFSHDLTRGEAICAGMDDYVTKPFNHEQLIRIVHSFVAQRVQ